MTIEKWQADLSKWIRSENIKTNELLKKYTMTQLGGVADVLVMPETDEQAQQVVHYAKEQGVPLFMLGNGSNMVVRDGGIRGIVIHFCHLNKVLIDGTTVVAGGGALIKEVSRLVAEQSLTGFEFACGIPGSIGGAMAMNAGAYGGEMKDITTSCKVITQDGEILVLSNEELDFGYRKSVIAKKGYYVLNATYELAKGDQQAIDEKIADLMFQRESKQPLEYPSAGSVFKRPPGMFAGKLIQDSGLQGKGVGGAEVSTKHAGFIVNKNNATATDYIETIKMVQRVVKEKFDVELEREVKIVGEDE